MIEIQVYSQEGRTGDKVEVDDAALGGKVNLPLVRQAVLRYEANVRQGTRYVKNRSDVQATTRKLYRQKHTGNARAGSRASNIRRGGGKAHAPQAQDWTQRMPKKARHAAVRSAMLARLQDNEVSLLESLSLEAPNTKSVATLLKDIGVRGTCLLVVDGEPEAVKVLWKSARNIAGVTVCRVTDMTAYDLLHPSRVVFTRSAFDAFMKAYAS